MMLYRITNRQLVPVRQLAASERASLGADWDAWLAAHGYGRDFTLRAGVVREATAREIAALGRPSAPVPSAATAILAKLARKAGEA